MAILNNVHIDRLKQVIKEAETDKSKVKRTQRVEGEWVLTEGGPQFKAEVSFEGAR